MYEYKYPRPMVTVDMVVLTADRKNIVLIKRRNEPCKGCWALPGGFIEMDETLEESAVRELREETLLSGIKLTKFDVFGDPGRDPRGRTITIAFWGICDNPADAHADDDAAELEWFSLDNLPELAFDHAKIIGSMKQLLGL